MQRSCVAGLCLGLLVFVSSAQADVIFDIEDVSVLPGQTATVGVFVSGSGENLDSFDLPIEIGNNAFGLPTGITGFSVISRNTFTAVTINLTEAPGVGLIKNFEAVFSDAGSSIALTAEPRRLFDLQITTDSNLTGTTPLSIFSSTDVNPLVLKNLRVGTSVPGVSNSLLTYTAEGSLGPGRTLILQAGSITAVPEPASVSSLLLLVGAATWVRRRR